MGRGGVRRATPEDVGPLSRVLARAFRADPAHRWIFPEEASRARNSHRLFATVLRLVLREGLVLTSQGREAAALWEQPERPEPGVLRRLALHARMLSLLATRTPLVMRGLRHVEARRPDEPHWYLMVLGADPAHQGRGLGSALLVPVLARCDASRAPAYLEASSQANVPFYERHGFEAVESIELPRGPRLTAMWRRARA